MAMNGIRSRTKLVYGVGINDAQYPVYICTVIGGRQKILWRCPFYRAWKEMLRRCYSEKYQEKQPTYIGCIVDTEWLRFSSFRLWMDSQPWQGMELDKDILIHENKIYGPEACVFVSGQLNKFMHDQAAARGELPIGVCWHKDDGKFMARCCNPFSGNREFLGYFACPQQAHEAWRAKKHEHACRYADMQSDPRIARSLRTRYAVTISASSTSHNRAETA